MPERPEGPEPRDRPDRTSAGDAREAHRERKVFGTTPGQTISRVLLVLGVLLMLWVVYVITRAFG